MQQMEVWNVKKMWKNPHMSTSAAHNASKENGRNVIHFMEKLPAVQAVALKLQFLVLMCNLI